MKKNIINIIVFSVILLSFMFLWIFKEKEEIVASERRKAAAIPPISEIFSESYSQNFDKAMSDTFPYREKFRKLNTLFRLDILHQKDVNGYLKAEGHVLKTEDTLNIEQIQAGAKKINELSEKFPESSKIYYSLIPDKNYFLASKYGYPHIDYKTLVSTLNNSVSKAEYIDIFPDLSIDDYYKTDSHWSQEKILPVAEKLISNMGKTPLNAQYTQNRIENFKGVYAVQGAINTPAEDMVYLTNDNINSAVVTSVEEKGDFPVYQTEKFEGVDPYDMFLGGAKALLTLERESDTENHLIIFRDSFGSSIAPLFLENYSKITLIDLRYISSSVIDDYVNFENADILFLYNTSIINNAMLLR